MAQAQINFSNTSIYPYKQKGVKWSQNPPQMTIISLNEISRENAKHNTEECSLHSQVVGSITKINIRIPLIKYIDHIKKHFGGRSYQLKVELFNMNSSEDIAIKKINMEVSKYFMYLYVDTYIILNTSDKICLSIYMINTLDHNMTHCDNFYEIDNYIACKRSYHKLRQSYKNFLLKQKKNEYELFESSESSESNSESESCSDDDNEDDTKSESESDSDNNSNEEYDKNKVKYISEAYLITDFYFDVADLCDIRNDVVTLKEFFTQAILQYFISQVDDDN